MKAIFTVADLQPESGGPSRSVSALADAVAGQGIDVELMALEYGEGAASPITPSKPVQMQWAPCRGHLNRKFKYSPHFKPGLLKQLRPPISDLPPSISHLSSLPPALIIHDTGLWLPTNHTASSIARKMQIPLIISPRGMLSSWALKFRGLKKRIAWALYQKRDLESARVLHATSHEEAKTFRAAGLRQPIAVIPNGVELPGAEGIGDRGQRTEDGGRWEKAESRKQKVEILERGKGVGERSQRSEVRDQRSEIREQTEAPKHRTLLFLGRLHPVKGLRNLVEAWSALNPSPIPHLPSSTPWRVVLAGGDENGHRAELERAVRDQGLDFEFAGVIEGDAKWELYRSADLFVLPSHSENFGLVVAEALACGVPVITTKGTPWQDMQTHGCGWWVDIGVEPLVQALREATALSDAERHEMGERGRALIESKYTWPAAAKQMLAVYRWMLSLGPKPECILD